MSRTAAFDGRSGTVQEKDFAFGSRIGVMHIVKVLPPSNDRNSFISRAEDYKPLELVA
jgi:hypothetical protein